MSTRLRAWLVGAAAGTSAVWYINSRFIEQPQRDLLLSLRLALVKPEVREVYENSHSSSNPVFPFFSRETLNLVLIAISDKFIFDDRVKRSD